MQGVGKKMNEFLGHASTDLAMQYLREGNLHDCIACAEKVVSGNPDDAKAYAILGAAYAQAGDKGMAIAAFEQSLAIEPSARAHFNLGMAYEKSERLREALDQYQRAVAMDPGYKGAAEALSRVTNLVGSGPPPPAYVPGLPHEVSAHLLGGDAPPEEMFTTPPPDAQQPPPQDMAGPPQSGQQIDPHAPHALGDDQAYVPPAHSRSGHQTVVDDLRPVGIAPPPPPPAAAPGRLPNLSDLEAKARANDAKVRQAQKQMIKAGLIYGIIAGTIVWSVLGLAAIAQGQVLSVIIPGVIVGGLIGLGIGITCGDEMTGLKIGAGIGATAFLVSILPEITQIHPVAIIGGMVLRAAVMAFLGYVIGIIVERSISD